MSYRSNLVNDREAIAEKTSPRITFLVVGEGNTPIPGSSLSSLVVTLYNEKTGAIVNGRSGTNVLNTNGGAVDANGVGYWELTAADTTLQSQDNTFEIHIALFEWTWSTGTKYGKWEVRHRIVNLSKVT